MMKTEIKETVLRILGEIASEAAFAQKHSRQWIF